MDNNQNNYRDTTKLIRDVLNTEGDNIDLVVLMGDTVNPDFEESFSMRFQDAVEELVKRNIPWVSVGGEDKPNNAVTREYMLQQDQSTGGKNDLSQSAKFQAISNVTDPQKLGLYTQRIPVYNANGLFDKGTFSFNIWIMDSLGGYDCYGNNKGKSCISKEAVEWFQTEVQKNPKTVQGDFVFTTYPLEEFMIMSNHYTANGNCGQQVCCQAGNTGFYKAAIDSKKVGWVIAGGDSDNDFKGQYQGINMAYARKSGFGGNGKLTRGARVIKVNVQDEIYWTQTYIRDYQGNSITQDGKNDSCQKGTDFKEQSVCCSIYGQNTDEAGDNIFYDDDGYLIDPQEEQEVSISILPYFDKDQ
eukprot:403338364